MLLNEAVFYLSCSLDKLGKQVSWLTKLHDESVCPNDRRDDKDNVPYTIVYHRGWRYELHRANKRTRVSTCRSAFHKSRKFLHTCTLEQTICRRSEPSQPCYRYLERYYTVLSLQFLTILFNYLCKISLCLMHLPSRSSLRTQVLLYHLPRIHLSNSSFPKSSTAVNFSSIFCCDGYH